MKMIIFWITFFRDAARWLFVVLRAYPTMCPLGKKSNKAKKPASRAKLGCPQLMSSQYTFALTGGTPQKGH